MKLRLTINKDTFIWLQETKGLAYNASNFKSFEFDISDEIQKICEHFHRLDNLYEVVLEESYNADIRLKEWIDNMLRIGSARITSFDKGSVPSLKPVLMVQYDLNKIVKDRSFTEAINCLKEITIHLNGLNLLKEEEDYYKQFIYPTGLIGELAIDKLRSFLEHVPQKENVKLNFVGDYASYSAVNELLEELDERINTIAFYFRIEDFYRLGNLVQNVIGKYAVYLHCKCTDELSKYVEFAKQKIDHPYFSFLVASEDDIQVVETIDKNGLKYNITPLYTGKNGIFFEEYIYISREDCLDSKIGKRHLFMNQALNGNFFGKLEILPDGSVCDNPNFSKLGFIDDNFFELLLSVFKQNRPWFYIRNQEPCTRCLYQWICPPPSNYEIVIGCPNLCHVKCSFPNIE